MKQRFVSAHGTEGDGGKNRPLSERID